MRESAVESREIGNQLLGLRSTGRSLATALVGGLVGGLAGASTAVLVTELIKGILAVVSSQGIWGLILLPLVGLALAVLVLQSYHHGEALQTIAPALISPRTRWRWLRVGATARFGGLARSTVRRRQLRR